MKKRRRGTELLRYAVPLFGASRGQLYKKWCITWKKSKGHIASIVDRNWGFMERIGGDPRHSGRGESLFPYAQNRNQRCKGSKRIAEDVELTSRNRQDRQLNKPWKN